MPPARAKGRKNRARGRFVFKEQGAERHTGGNMTHYNGNASITVILATDDQDGHRWSRLVASAGCSAQTPCPERLTHPPGLICEQFLAPKTGPDDFLGAGRPRNATGHRAGGCS